VIRGIARALLVSAASNAILCAPIWRDVVLLHEGIINRHYQMRKSTLVTSNKSFGQ
jgi:hypothetical protein